jgi:hypothetical protein
MDPEVLESGAGIIGIVMLVVGLLVWAIKKIVDMIERQLTEQTTAVKALGAAIVDETKALTAGLAGLRQDFVGLTAATQQIAERVDALANQGDITPPLGPPRSRLGRSQ